ncbi:unnamed protein product, partial [Trichogramma brassicae]
MFAEPESDTFEVCAGLSELSEEQEAAVRVVVERWLTAEPGALGLTRLTEHHIDVQGASPIKHKMRRMTPAMLQVTHDEIAKMLAQGVIEPSASAWSSAPVIVKKADGSNRFCIDYRDLNKVTKKDAYPVQNIDGILDKLRSAKYISTIDLKSAYFQIAMEESSKQYTAFAVPGAGLFQFTRLAYGLTNAPMAFQRLIDAVFGPECEPFVFGYLDDIVIVTETFQEHLRWLEEVLKRLHEAGLTINRKKCEFCRSSVKYLGYVLDGEGLRVDEDKVAPVLSYSAPHDIKSLRRFLGMVGWYSRFIPSDAELKLPLLTLTRKSVEWAWTEEQQNAFEALKQALTQAPVLARPDFTKPFIVQTDASAYAIGGVLTQVFDDGEHPIVYVSRVLAAAERNYTTSEKRVPRVNLDNPQAPPVPRGISLHREGWKLVVPKPLRERVMYDAHDITSSGHLGIEKTFDRVKRDYYWRGMYHDVFEYVMTCDACQRYKISQTGPQGLMGRRVIERPWSLIACDLMEFPASKSQNKYLIVFQDLFTRWIELKPVQRATRKAVASALEELVLFRWETPEFLICDNGKEQVNKDVSEVLDAYGIRQVTTPAYWAAPNPVERSNRTLKTTIALF